MNVVELITNSYYLSRILAREFETISDTQVSDGLVLLNDVLSEKNISSATIPYHDTSTFTAVVGQEKYIIPNLVSLDSLTYELNEVRYNMNQLSRKRYFTQMRVNNIQSLPQQFFVERQLGFSNIYVYYLPDKDYEFTMTGKFALQEVSLFDDLSGSYDKFYLSYIKYLLAQRICDLNSQTVPEGVSRRVKELKDQIFYFSGVDLSCRINNPFQGSSLYDPIQAQLSNGFTPP